jgi:hypothetical protein
MLAPKAKKGKKKKKASDEPEPVAENEPGSPEGGAAKKKKKKKKKAKKSSIPEPLPMKYGAPQTCEQALANTVSWSQNNNIALKRATGVLTTVAHD